MYSGFFARKPRTVIDIHLVRPREHAGKIALLVSELTRSCVEIPFINLRRCQPLSVREKKAKTERE